MAAADLSATSFGAVIKQLYPQTDIQRLLYENQPLWAMLTKKYDFFGTPLTLALKYATTQGRSARFPNAKANKTPSKLGRFLVTHETDYSLYSVDGKSLRISSNSKGAIVKMLEEEVDSALEAWKRSAGISVYRNGGGAIGRVLSGGTTATITLTNVNDIVNFEVGMWLVASSDDGAQAAPAGLLAGGPIQVTAVNRDTGTVTAAAAWTASIAGLVSSASGSYLFADGDYGAKIKGLDAWLPSAAPTSGDSFFGLDRSVDPVRLAGNRVTATGLNPEEALQKGAQVLYRNGGKPTHCFMNDSDFLNLQLSVGTSRAIITQASGAKIGKVDLGVSFDGISVTGPAGPIKVFADPNCPASVAYMLQMDTWSLRGAGEFPYIDATDGNRMLREDSADAYEGRINGVYQMMCDAPGYNARIAF